jgi:uncharacterized protein YjdB
MKKIYLLLFACFISLTAYCQTTVTIYAGGGLPTTDSITGYANTFAGTRVKDTIISGAGGYRGYAVMDLTSIPTGASITSCTINFNVSDTFNLFGTGNTFNTRGFAGDLSLVTSPATLYTNCGSGTSLSTVTYSGLGNHTLPSTGAATTFISGHIGSKVSITFTNGGGTRYKISGESGAATLTGVHAPYLQVTYCPGPNAGPTSVCVGNTITLTNTVGGGTWSSSNVGVATVGSTGIVTGISQGTANISYTLGTCVSSTTVTVNTTPSAIVGPDAVCAGHGATETNTALNGVWISSNTLIATVGSSTGAVLGVSAGTFVLSYTSCGTTVTKPMTVNAVSAISGPTTVCIGNTITLTDVTVPGTWSSGSPAVASIGSSTGIVTGLTVGTSAITYTASTGCQAFYTVTVSAAVNTISGPSTVCTGSTIALTDATPLGTWSSSAPGTATIGSSSGIVTGIAPGTTTITYTVNAGCTTSTIITVNASPSAINPPGSVSICVGGTVSLSDATPSGAWSASNGNATVSVGGLVTGIVAGVDTISYTVGGCAATKTVTINATPAVTLPHNPTICAGASVSLTNTVPGGTWTSSTPGVATVVGGLVNGVSAGTAVISYAIGSCRDLDTVTVSIAPAPITPSLPLSICAGQGSTLSDATPGGTWSSSNTLVATVTGGTVTGVSAGVVNISYSIGTCFVIKSVTINLTPVAIVPFQPTICVGSNITFTDATPGGSWTSGNVGVATMAGGLVTGVSPGRAEITYNVGGCSVTDSVFVVAPPSAITPGTPVTVCVGFPFNLADPTPGGVWSSGNVAIATVGSTGIVTGVGVGVVNISYTVGSCFVFKTVTVNAGPAAITPATATVCTGLTTTLTDATPGGVWSSSNGAVATVAGGVVTGVSSGIVTITYSNVSCYALATVTVNASPDAGTITGPNNECVSTTMTLFDAAPGGVWSSSSLGVATVSPAGDVFGVSAGTALISYSVTNTCGNAVATYMVTINTTPSPGTIIGASLVCAGTTTVYTDATTGGVWSSSNSTATINPVTGLLTAITPGTDTIRYTITASCGTAVATKIVNIGPYLSAGTISGPSAVCAGSSIILTDPATGGVWSSSAPGVASVAGGVVTGLSAGTTTITYTVTSGCGSATATHAVTVNPLPVAGSIVGPTAICIGSPTLYTDAAPGGVWSLTNSHATISVGGLVTPVSIGADTIRYTVTNGCGTASTSKVITIGAFLTAGTISGPSGVCVGSTITLTDATPGGVWSSTNTAAATVAGGVVTGISAGVTVISYTVTSSCGTVAATQTVTVNPIPDAGSISGFSAVCIGTPATYTDAAPGGVWSMSNGNATITGGGVVTPLISGNDTVIYTFTNACGTAVATKAISISTVATAGVISGPNDVCVGSTITLTDPVTGGTWTSSDPAVASISGGVVSGLTSGVVTISYTVTGSCGTAVATKMVTVSIGSSPGTIIGPSTVCQGSFTIYTDAAPGGVWSMTNSNATVTGVGVVTAITVGTDTLVYTISNACGTVSATKAIDITPFSGAGIISGPSNVCVGSTITLTESVPGGTWSASNSHATVSGLGIVTGASNGVDTISYTVTGPCGTFVATHVVNVSSGTDAGLISGPSSVCVGAVITLTDPVSGGVWNSSNIALATVSGGVVTGVSTGNVTISYTVTDACGTATATKLVAVTTTPFAGTITGPSTVCVGATITLADTISGGTWSSSNLNSTVGSSTGIVTGMAAGTSVITYTVTNACGSNGTTKNITINASPVVSPISGPGSQCVGTVVTFADATPGGVWSSSAPAIASIGSGTGMATGVSAGTALITYTVSSGGCSAFAIAIDTVIPGTVIPAITGGTNVCVGGTLTLSDSVSGGTWSASNGNATVIGGVVTGVTSGMDTIMYTVSTSCGTATVSSVITVSDPPNAGFVSGPANVCAGSSITLVDSMGGAGIWSSSNSHATVGSSTGVVTGVTSGVDTIMYTVTNACGSAVAIHIINIGLLPNAGVITGPTGVCVGASVTVMDTVAGGIWSMSNARATITSTGIVTGVTGGMDTIRYAVTNSCGTATATRAIAVNQAPSAGSITGPTGVCPGATITLSVSGGTPGGSWSSSNSATASVAGGVVTGHIPGTVTISYSVSNACGSRSASRAVAVLEHSQCNTMVSNVTGSDDISVYPNPATSFLNIDASIKVNVSVLSIDGKILIQQKGATSVNVRNLANGMYIIMIYDENNQLVKTTKFAKSE